MLASGRRENRRTASRNCSCSSVNANCMLRRVLEVCVRDDDPGHGRGPRRRRAHHRRPNPRTSRSSSRNTGAEKRTLIFLNRAGSPSASSPEQQLGAVPRTCKGRAGSASRSRRTARRVRINVQRVVVPGEAVDVCLVVADSRRRASVGCTVRDRDFLGIRGTCSLERFDVAELTHTASERAVDHLHVDVAVSIGHVALELGRKPLPRPARVNADDARAHEYRAGGRQRLNHLEVAFGVDVERPGRVRH